MISRQSTITITGLPARVPSYANICDDIEAMIRDALPGWQNQITQTSNAENTGEKELTSSLCIFLEQTAREQSVSWGFHHEHPQKGSRSEDMSLVPGTTKGIWIEQAFYANDKRFYAIEAKRLPTPPDPKKKRDRKREYVCGDWQRAQDETKPISGGIERFKENKHGEGLSRSGMVAFIQKQNSDHWFNEVNGWIDEVCKANMPCYKARWSAADHLSRTSNGSAVHSEHLSSHARPSRNSSVTLRHFWIQLA